MLKPNVFRLVIITLFIAGWGEWLHAGVPAQITYQGMLKEYGQPVTGTRTMDFSIYPVATGGASLWSSNGNSVTVTNGVFSQTLTPTFDLRANQELYIELFVSSKKLAPREKISSQFFALNSANAENISSTGTITITVGSTPRVLIDGTSVHVLAGGIMFADGTVQTSASVAGATAIPVGTILPYGGSTAPSGFLFCDGTLYATGSYPALYAVIGTTYGGGSGSFNVPNLQDRFPIGEGGTISLGSTGGSTSISVSNMPSHGHSLTMDAVGAHSHTFTGDALPEHQHDIASCGGGGTGHSGAIPTGYFSGQTPTFADKTIGGGGGPAINSVSAGTPTGTIGSAGGHTPTGVANAAGSGTAYYQPYVAINYIMKYYG